MQTTLENDQTKFHSKISSEFWEITVFVGGRFLAAACIINTQQKTLCSDEYLVTRSSSEASSEADL